MVQTSRKKGSAYIDSFETRIKPALRIATDLNPKVVSKMKKIVKVWGDRKCYPRKTITWMNGAFNTSEKEHEGTPPNSPHLANVIDSDSDNAPTPSPNYDEEGGSDGKSAGTPSPNFDAETNEGKKKKEAEVIPIADYVQMEVANDELGRRLTQHCQNIDQQRINPGSITYELQTGQMTPALAKERIVDIARLLKQCEDHTAERKSQKRAYVARLEAEIAQQEEALKALEEKIEQVEESQEILEEIRSISSDKENATLKKKRKKLKNKDLPKNLKINWDDEDADDDKGADDKDTDRAGEAEDSQKSVPMVWDRTLKQYVPIRKDDGGSWRDH